MLKKLDYQTYILRKLKYKRLAIFAAYNAEGMVSNADILYIKELKKVVDNIIFIADNELQENSVNKLKQYVCYIEAYHHGEYDFGSYKRGFEYALKKRLLDNIEELILCNDSCYAPLNDFNKMFSVMKKNKCDFWGITENIEFSRHIQSFFVVMRKNVFTSEVFKNFIKKIKKQNSVQDVIKNYEIGLSSILLQSGFTAQSYIKYPNQDEYPLTIVKGFKNLTAAPIWCVKQGSPLVKKKAFRFPEANYEGFLRLWLFCVLRNVSLISSLPPLRNCIYFNFSKYKKIIIRFFYQRKITKSGKILIKICKIPVYSKKL